MNYRLPDEEYAVLDYIRSRNGTHIDHLKITFGPVAVTAVDHLYQYGLIDPDFPNEDIWYASDLGKAYRHKEAEQSDIKLENNKKDHKADPEQVDKKSKKPSKKRINWSAVSAVGTILGKIIDFFVKLFCP